MTIKTRELESLFNINKSTLTNWKKLGADVAYLGLGQWDLGKFIFWWADNIHSAGRSDEPSGTVVSADELSKMLDELKSFEDEFKSFEFDTDLTTMDMTEFDAILNNFQQEKN